MKRGADSLTIAVAGGSTCMTFRVSPHRPPKNSARAGGILPARLTQRSAKGAHSAAQSSEHLTQIFFNFFFFSQNFQPFLSYDPTRPFHVYRCNKHLKTCYGENVLV
jgi:hypothetical protein